MLEPPVEALGSVNLVVSLGYIGSIADLDEMASAFAEISAGWGHYFGHPDAAIAHGYLGSPTESCFLSTGWYSSQCPRNRVARNLLPCK